MNISALKYCLIAFVIATMALSSTAHGIEDQIANLKVEVVYDLQVNEGLTVLDVTLTERLVNAIVDIKLISNNVGLIVDVVDEYGNTLPYSYDEVGRVISVFVNGTKKITITYMVSGLFDEIGIDAYSGIIDLTEYAIPLEVTIIVSGSYSTVVEPEAEVLTINDTTRIKLTRQGLYILTLWKEPTLEEDAQTVGSMVTSPTAEHTPSAPETRTPYSQQPSPPPAMEEAEYMFDEPLYLYLVITVFAVIAILALLMARKK